MTKNNSDYLTEQERFWAGEFGNNYIARNNDADVLAANLSLFSEIISHACGDINSVIEFGANIGMNLRAIHQLLPKASLCAVEINSKAIAELCSIDYIKSHQQSILDYISEDPCDLTLIKGVLIHINPDHLNTVYDALYNNSKRYICIVEYYNPTPVTVTYRGHENRLFKRDFAGELMDRFPGLRLIKYGFRYRRDPNFLHDDETWFLLEKHNDR